MQETFNTTVQGMMNAARQLGYSDPTGLIANQYVIRRILEQHLLPTAIPVEDMSVGQRLRTLDFGNPLTVQQG